jgi:hypothetical protein
MKSYMAYGCKFWEGRVYWGIVKLSVEGRGAIVKLGGKVSGVLSKKDAEELQRANRVAVRIANVDPGGAERVMSLKLVCEPNSMPDGMPPAEMAKVDGQDYKGFSLRSEIDNYRFSTFRRLMLNEERRLDERSLVLRTEERDVVCTQGFADLAGLLFRAVREEEQFESAPAVISEVQEGVVIRSKVVLSGVDGSYYPQGLFPGDKGKIPDRFILAVANRENIASIGDFIQAMAGNHLQAIPA